jgi:hypothetical protein
MSRKIWIIIIAGAAILLLNNLHVFGRTGFGAAIDFALTIAIIYRAVILVKRAGSAIKPLSIKSSIHKATAAQPSRSPGQTPIAAGGLSPAWVLTFIFLFIMTCFSYRILAAAGLNFFVWGDHVLGAGRGNPPILLWALAGLFLGAVAGSLVMWRKYHIKFQWCLGTLIPFLSVLVFLQVLSDPLQAITPRPLLAAVDSNQMHVVDSIPVKPKRRRHKPAKQVHLTDTAAQQTVAAVECTKLEAGISINARADSVNVFYRTASYQNGPWGPWKSKFIHQPGQFSLTDEGQVRANSLQYYYETKAVLTRSAQNPYTRLLCEGPLVIDTY